MCNRFERCLAVLVVPCHVELLSTSPRSKRVIKRLKRELFLDELHLQDRITLTETQYRMKPNVA